jgi:hypothetical protein
MATLLTQALAALEGAAALWLHTTSPEVMFQFNQFKEALMKVLTPFTCIELFMEYLACTQAKGENVRLFYFCLLLKQVGLTNVNLLASQFCEGQYHHDMRCIVLRWGVIAPSRSCCAMPCPRS